MVRCCGFHSSLLFCTYKLAVSFQEVERSRRFLDACIAFLYNRTLESNTFSFVLLLH